MRQLLIASLNGGWAGCGHGVENEKQTLHKTLVCADCNRKKHFRFTVRPFQMDECFVVEPAKKKLAFLGDRRFKLVQDWDFLLVFNK